MNPSVTRPCVLGRGADAGEVDVRRDVLVARPLSHGGVCAAVSGPAIVWRVNDRQRAGGVRGGIEVARLVAVVDQDQEAPAKAARRRRGPSRPRAG